MLRVVFVTGVEGPSSFADADLAAVFLAEVAAAGGAFFLPAGTSIWALFLEFFLDDAWTDSLADAMADALADEELVFLVDPFLATTVVARVELASSSPSSAASECKRFRHDSMAAGLVSRSKSSNMS